MSSRNRAYLFLLITTIIWGAAGPVIKFTVEQMPPFIFLAYRFGLQAMLGLVWLKFIPRPGWPKDLINWIKIVIYSIITVPIALGLLFYGYDQTSAIAASLINAIYPIMVAVVGVIWLRERVTVRERWGMGLAFLGTIMVVSEPFFNGRVIHGTSLIGNLLIMTSLVVGVASVVMAKLIMRRGINPLAMTHMTFIIGVVCLIPITLSQHGLSSTITTILSAPLPVHLGVLYMAFLSGTLAYWLWIMAQKTIEIGETAMFTYLYPIITLPLSLFWLKESIPPVLILGAVIIAAGVILAQTKKKRINR